MLKYFICPDGGKVELTDCLVKCRLGKRCLTKPTLVVLSKVRPWEGIPSVTQLLNGTLLSFLQITKDYAESPDSMAYRLLGTTVHAGLEEEVEGTLIEEKTKGDNVSGTLDLLEFEDNWNILTDYKTSGSYKVAKALGAYETWADHPKDVYKQKTCITINGIKEERLKGQPKVVKSIKFDIQKQDCIDWVRQLNKYRINIEEKKGIKVDELRIQAIVRDGNTITARNRGLFQNMYLIPIPHLPDDEIREYFNRKRDNLLKALEQGHWDEQCTKEERWDGMRCEKYCAVNMFCQFYKETTT